MMTTLFKKGKKSRLLDVERLDNGAARATFLLADARTPRLASIALEADAVEQITAQLRYVEETGQRRTSVFGIIEDIRFANLVAENEEMLRPEYGENGEIDWRRGAKYNAKTDVNRDKGVEISLDLFGKRTAFPAIPFDRLNVAVPNDLNLKPTIDRQTIDTARDIHLVHAHVLKTRGMSDEVMESGFILDLNRAIDALDVARATRIVGAGVVRSDSSLFGWTRNDLFTRPMNRLVAKMEALSKEEKTADPHLRSSKGRAALSILDALIQSSFLKDLGEIGALSSSDTFKAAYLHALRVIENQQFDRQQQIDAFNENCFIGYVQRDSHLDINDALLRYRLLREQGWLPGWEALRNTVRRSNIAPLMQAMLTQMDVAHPPAFHSRWESALYQAVNYRQDDNAAMLIENGFPYDERDIHDIRENNLPKTCALLEYRLLKEKAAETNPAGPARIRRSAP